MKKGLLLLFIAISALSFSCKKDKAAPRSLEIYGKWKLTETMTDPGDGSGKYMKATGEPKYLNFNKDGKLEGNALSFDTFRYKILDSTKMEVLYNVYLPAQIFGYKLSEENLEIYPRCIEGCGLRFVRQ
ncbi:hypothetical protein DBR43_04115 [Pedobacter sp. KBW06]|uniref:hypothetical protein n=1 Tax=Pedobacter sp. KBW06 TaxID=2153359 RepID=UPI000F5A2618|nr:hypothetical protein [Pedobacter sp. KBW06]RQO74581.1 hypothetical protein DBR43_04115 [Pedobacter sp. KBW06]